MACGSFDLYDLTMCCNLLMLSGASLLELPYIVSLFSITTFIATALILGVSVWATSRSRLI